MVRTLVDQTHIPHSTDTERYGKVRTLYCTQPSDHTCRPTQGETDTERPHPSYTPHRTIDIGPTGSTHVYNSPDLVKVSVGTVQGAGRSAHPGVLTPAPHPSVRLNRGREVCRVERTERVLFGGEVTVTWVAGPVKLRCNKVTGPTPLKGDAGLEGRLQVRRRRPTEIPFRYRPPGGRDGHTTVMCPLRH